MKRLLIATRNPGKLKEIKSALTDLAIKIVTLQDLQITEEVAEDGKTFEENAIKKARFYCQQSGLPTIADDGGLEIDILGGEPGVKSRRWIDGQESADEELIAHALKKLKSVPLKKRGAQLRTVLVLAFPDGQIFASEGKVRGIIAQKQSKKRTKGYPYRSLLYLPAIKKYYHSSQLSQKEKAKYAHRVKAVEKFKKIIKERIL